MKKSRLFFIALLCLFAFNVKAQNNGEERSKISLGARYAFVCNVKIAHHKLCFTLMYRQHDFYIGGQYSPVLKPFWGDGTRTLYDDHTFGLNTGYKYYFFRSPKKIRLFAQLDFSIYQIRYQTWGLGPGVTNQKEIIIENTALVGMDWNIYKGLYLFAGAGIGSYDKFFLMLDSFIPSFQAGLEYRF